MAQVPNTQGVASVAPSEETSQPYQSARGADASAFGGDLAQAGERLGQGMQIAGKYFNKVAADDASNQYQDFTTKLLHGDPNKTLPGPDGQPIPDVGYLGTKGRAALDQRPEIDKQLEAERKRIAAGLQSPEQQQEFENYSRRLKNSVTERVGSHATSQSTTWYESVNTASAKLAMDHISNNFDNPKEVLHGASDLTAAYVKNAQLKYGAGMTDSQVQEAVAAAKRDGLEAQLQAMAVKDPSRALAVLDKNRDIAGIRYDDMANKFRTRAEQQRGIDAGEQAIKRAYIKNPQGGYTDVNLTEVGAPYGISGSYLQRVNQLENAAGVQTENRAGAQGPFQFTRGTAAQYKLPLNERNDPVKSADAAARLAADNRDSLARNLGRPPTDAETYLAHQQGAGGAARLLRNPNMRAGDLVGNEAIRQNGGDPDAPAYAFTSMWTAKFAGAPGAATATRKATAYQEILADQKLNPQERQHALAYVNQQMTAQNVAMEEDAKAKKLASDKSMDGFVQRMLTGQNTANIVNEIANDPNLDPSVKWSLGQAAEKHSGSDLREASLTYGPGFWEAYKQVTAPMNDPSRISDPSALLRLAGPEAAAEHSLTLNGLAKLQGIMRENAKSVDAASVNATKTGLMTYAKGKLSFEQDTGPIKIRDPEGEAIFNSVFIPKFEAGYDQWIKAGKNPYEYLTRENIDKVMEGMRDKSKMEAARLNATGQAPPQVTPPAPKDVDPYAWERIVTRPPRGANGNWPLDKWSTAIDRLRDNPTDEMKKAFDQKFAPSGYTADYVLKRLPAKKKGPAADAPAGGGLVIEDPTIKGILDKSKLPAPDAGKRKDESSLRLDTPDSVLPVGIRG